MNPTHKYDDIIHNVRHISMRRSPMTQYDRAAQFSPFAALTGYDGVIAETGRLTDDRIELEADGMALLDEKLQWIRMHLPEMPLVQLLVFRPDERKSGGAYEKIRGRVKKIDQLPRQLVLEGGTRIPLDRIYGIEYDL